MGACAMLPRIIGQGRAAELLYTGRVMTAAEGATNQAGVGFTGQSALNLINQNNWISSHTR